MLPLRPSPTLLRGDAKEIGTGRDPTAQFRRLLVTADCLCVLIHTGSLRPVPDPTSRTLSHYRSPRGCRRHRPPRDLGATTRDNFSAPAFQSKAERLPLFSCSERLHILHIITSPITFALLASCRRTDPLPSPIFFVCTAPVARFALYVLAPRLLHRESRCARCSRRLEGAVESTESLRSAGGTWKQNTESEVPRIPTTDAEWAELVALSSAVSRGGGEISWF